MQKRRMHETPHARIRLGKALATVISIGYLQAATARRSIVPLLLLGLVSCSGGDGSSELAGMDVSYSQGDIGWETVKNNGVAFAYIKVSEGLTITGTKFRQNWEGAKAADIRHGGYHLFTPGDSGTAQAQHFVDSLETAGVDYHGALPPVLDVEQIPQDQLIAAKPEIGAWLSYVYKHLLCKPIIYTSPGTWNGEFPDEFTPYALWLALYEDQHKQGQKPRELPEGWSNWRFWQFTDKGAVTGIDGPVNLDYFNGTKTDLLLTTCIGW